MVTDKEKAFLRAFVRSTNFEPLKISKEELEENIGDIIVHQQYEEDGSITLTFKEA